MAEIPIVFREYTSNRLEQSQSQEIRDKYIYVFQVRSDGIAYWYCEIYANKTGKYQLLPTRKAQSLRDRRTPIEDRRTSIGIPEEDSRNLKTYMCLSKFMLPYERILKIRRELQDGKNQRLTEITIGQSSAHSRKMGSQGTVYLTDHFEIAHSLNKSYVDARNEYLEWNDNEKLGSVKHLTDVVLAITDQNPDLRERLKDDGRKARDWKNRYDRKERDLRVTADRAAVQLMKFIDQPVTESILQDYEAGGLDRKSEGEEIFAKAILRISEGVVGRSYLKKIYLDKKSWLNTSFLFQTGRKVNGAFSEIVQELATVITELNIKQNKHIAIIREIIQTRTSIVLKTKTQVLKYSAINVIYREIKIEVVTFDMDVNTRENWAHKISDSKAYQSFGMLVEVFNLCFAIKALVESKKSDFTKNAISLAGALTDFLASSAFLAEKLANRKLGETAGKVALKKSVAALGIISGISDAIVGGMDATTEFQEGDYDAMVGHGLIGAGGLATAIGSCFALAAASGSTVVGAPVAVIFVVAGIITSIVGYIIVFFYDDSPIEEWLMYCHWGTRRHNIHDDHKREWSNLPFDKWPGQIEEQISAFYNIAYDFKVKAYLEGSKVIVEIEPSGYINIPHYVVHLWYGSETPASHKETIRLSHKNTKETLDLDDDSYKVIKLTATLNPQRRIDRYRTMYCGVQHDMTGDGKLVVPNNKHNMKIDKVF